MLHEEDDPLNSSVFGSNSILGNTLSSTMFSSQFDEDPWGSHTTPNIQSSITTSPDISINTRSYENSFYSTTSDAANSRVNGTHYNATNILSGVRLPNIYQQMYEQYERSGRISVSSLNSVLSKGRIAAYQIEKIMQLVVPTASSSLSQSEFNTALALLACAQNNIDLSLGSLNQNKNFLPEPSVYESETIKSPLTAETNQNAPEPKPNNINKAGYPGMKSPNHSTTTVAKTAEGPKVQENRRSSTSLDTSRWFKNMEEITVTVAPEREGFIFKHVNYIVTNEKRSSIVLRRYSDFWWLWEVLIRRYPFRSLPNLPPKKLGGRDAAFLEKRRKGLSRFINAIIRHPVLRQDEIVGRFLTEPSELSAWRKQNPPNLDEEFKRKSFPIQELDNMTPMNLEEQLQKMRKRVTASINHYVNLCFIMERMIRRMHGQAADFSRYSIALNSLAEAELRYHAGECRNCQRVVRGYETVARHMQTESSLLEDQVGSATDGVLEDLKRFRDLLVSFRDLDERREKLSENQMDAISRRLATNRTKVHQNKGVPGLEVEVEKLEESIRTDELELSRQQDREVFIRFCMWSELVYLHKQQAFVSSIYQSYVKDSVQYSKLRANNWQDLEEPVSDMPGSVDLFE